MAHFAKVLDNVVVQVIVAEQAFIDSMVDTSPGKWIQTSYNTKGGLHTDGGTPLRKNYAGVGYLYDGVGFYRPQPYASWTLNSTTYLWEAPTPYPTDGKEYEWNEADQRWDEVT